MVVITAKTDSLIADFNLKRIAWSGAFQKISDVHRMFGEALLQPLIRFKLVGYACLGSIPALFRIPLETSEEKGNKAHICEESSQNDDCKLDPKCEM